MMLPLVQADVGNPSAVLQVLQDQQVAYTVQLKDATRGYNEAALEYEHAAGAQKDAARAKLTEFESRVVSTEQRLNSVNERIADVKHDIQMGHPASAGVTVADERWRIFGRTPTEFYSTGGFILLLPLVLAVARRIWKGGSRRNAGAASLEGSPQIARLEQAVEAIAIEVERISEAQRFSAKLLAERPVEARMEPEAPRRAKRPVITPLP